MMNQELLIALAFGFMVGAALGWWRCMVYCRKLHHFGVNLDAWAHYDAVVRQGQRPPDDGKIIRLTRPD